MSDSVSDALRQLEGKLDVFYSLLLRIYIHGHLGKVDHERIDKLRRLDEWLKKNGGTVSFSRTHFNLSWELPPYAYCLIK